MWRDEENPEHGIHEKCVHHDNISTDWNKIFADYEGNLIILTGGFKEFLDKNFK